MASVWLDEYESAVDLKSETRSLIQVSLIGAGAIVYRAFSIPLKYFLYYGKMRTFEKLF